MYGVFGIIKYFNDFWGVICILKSNSVLLNPRAACGPCHMARWDQWKRILFLRADKIFQCD